MNNFRWTVRKVNKIIQNGEEKTIGPIWFDDLKCWIGYHGINEKQMHHQYSLEQLENSPSFQQGLNMGWIETIDKHVPGEATELVQIKQQMSDLVGLVQQMASAQPVVINNPSPSAEIDNSILKQILDKISINQNIPLSKPLTDRTAQEAALKVREKMNIDKVSTFESLGNKTKTNIDIDKLADALDNLPLDDND